MEYVTYKPILDYIHRKRERGGEGRRGKEGEGEGRRGKEGR